jgi:hypothetical protein
MRRINLKLVGILVAVFPTAILAQASRPIGQSALPAAPSNIQSTRLPWLHEGLQLTQKYTVIAISGGRGQWHEEADGGFSSGDGRKIGAADRQQKAAASGLIQEMITALDGDYALVSRQGYSWHKAEDMSDPVPDLAGSDARFVSAADSSGDWMSLGRLNALKSDPERKLTVSKLQWKVGDKMQNAIRIEQSLDGDVYYKSEVYDLGNGMCLHSAQITTGPAPKNYEVGKSTAGDSLLIQTDYDSARNVFVPWGNVAWPELVRNIHVLHFHGQSSTDTQIQLDISMSKWGTGWVVADLTRTEQLSGGSQRTEKSQTAFGHWSLMPIWIPPQMLAQMHQEDEFDRDEPAQTKTYISRLDDNRAVIECSNGSGGFSTEFDKHTGLRIGMRNFVNGPVKNQTTLQTAGQQ